jgi:hypothetical protein
VISEHCAPGSGKCVVEVTGHGWLPHHSSYYYIDMEYCLETLEDRIHGVVLVEESNTDSASDHHADHLSGPINGFKSGYQPSQTTTDPPGIDLRGQ